MWNPLIDPTDDPFSSAKDDAWNEGWSAYRAEKNVNQNPYTDEILKQAWEDGYMDHWEMDTFHGEI